MEIRVKELVIVVVLLFVAVLGFSYAYLAPMISDDSATNISVKSKTVDSLSFESSDDISIEASQFNFFEGGGDLSDTAVAKAILQANNVANANYCYNARVVISKNEFTYTTSEKIPELLFDIKKNGSIIYTQKDVTTSAGIISVPTVIGGNDYKHVISAEAGDTTTDEFEITVYFVNLATDQHLNAGKDFDAKLELVGVPCE